MQVIQGEDIQIRSVYSNAGDLALFGNSAEKAILLAIEDYGTIHGFDVDLGLGLDDLCTPEGGMVSGTLAVAEGNVAGVIGTNCSSAATYASRLIAGAGMVLISPSNTSPSLTSDLAGAKGSAHYPGYYRTVHNDLIQGEASAHFLNDMGVLSAAVVHDGGPYTLGLATAFSNAFTEHGGTVTGTWQMDRLTASWSAEGQQRDLPSMLTEIAETRPEALFFPLLFPLGALLVEEAATMPAFSDVIFATADGMLTDRFMSSPESEGTYISGPDTRFGNNTNQSTGTSATDLLARLEEREGGSVTNAFWGHAYDATVILLDAITAASHLRPGDNTLVIDRAGIREHLNNLSGFQGVTGVLTCDEFGDCGASRVVIHHHLDPTDPQATRENIVFEIDPEGPIH